MLPLLAYQPPSLEGVVAEPCFEVGFPLRCFQWLSFPGLATQLCPFRTTGSP